MSGFVGRNNAKITNRPSGGGDKLQGMPATTDKRASSIRAIQNRAWGENRNLVFNINQLGGVGRHKSQFLSNAGGVSGPNIESPDGGGNDPPPDVVYSNDVRTFTFDYLPTVSPEGSTNPIQLRFNVQAIPHESPTPTPPYMPPPVPTCTDFDLYSPPHDHPWEGWPYPNPKQCANEVISTCPHLPTPSRGSNPNNQSSFLQIGPVNALNYNVGPDATGHGYGYIGIRVCDDQFNYLGFLGLATDETPGQQQLKVDTWQPDPSACDYGGQFTMGEGDPDAPTTYGNFILTYKATENLLNSPTDDYHEGGICQSNRYSLNYTPNDPALPGVINGCRKCPAHVGPSITVGGTEKWWDDYHMSSEAFAQQWSVDADNILIQTPTGAGGRLFLGSSSTLAANPPWDGAAEPNPVCGWAVTGQWQIDIQLNHQDKKCWCECFYLAGRTNDTGFAPYPLQPGCLNYADGNGSGGTETKCTEIDICETTWGDPPCTGHTTNIINFGSNTGGSLEGGCSLEPLAGHGTWMSCGARLTATKVEIYYQLRADAVAGDPNKGPGALIGSLQIPVDLAAPGSTTHAQQMVPYIGTWCICKVDQSCSCTPGSNNLQREANVLRLPNGQCQNQDSFNTRWKNFKFTSVATTNPLAILL